MSLTWLIQWSGTVVNWTMTFVSSCACSSVFLCLFYVLEPAPYPFSFGHQISIWWHHQIGLFWACWWPAVVVVVWRDVTSVLEPKSCWAAQDLALWGHSSVYGAGLKIRMTAHTLPGFPLADWALHAPLPLSWAWRPEQWHYLQMLGGCVCVCVCEHQKKREWSASGRLEKGQSVRYGCRQRRHTSETPTQPSNKGGLHHSTWSIFNKRVLGNDLIFSALKMESIWVRNSTKLELQLFHARYKR